LKKGKRKIENTKEGKKREEREKKMK